MHSLLHLAAAQASGANAHTLAGAVHDGADGPQVHIPTPFCDVVGVAYVISKLRSFTADIAYLRHEKLSKLLISIAASEGYFRKAALS